MPFTRWQHGAVTESVTDVFVTRQGHNNTVRFPTYRNSVCYSSTNISAIVVVLYIGFRYQLKGSFINH